MFCHETAVIASSNTVAICLNQLGLAEAAALASIICASSHSGIDVTVYVQGDVLDDCKAALDVYKQPRDATSLIATIVSCGDISMNTLKSFLNISNMTVYDIAVLGKYATAAAE